MNDIKGLSKKEANFKLLLVINKDALKI